MARHIDPVCSCAAAKASSCTSRAAAATAPSAPSSAATPPPACTAIAAARPSEYGVRLREKQKLKRFYGVFERQFRRYFELASRSPENTGEVLLSILERRLDNVVHRLGLAQSRAAARQLVSARPCQLNGKACDIPSLLVKTGDTVKVKKQAANARSWSSSTSSDHPQPMPDFLEMITSEPPEAA